VDAMKFAEDRFFIERKNVREVMQHDTAHIKPGLSLYQLAMLSVISKVKEPGDSHEDVLRKIKEAGRKHL
jgi:hypothetical protein